MPLITDEYLQTYLDNELTSDESERLESAIAADPELRRREAELRNLLGDCSWFFASLDTAAAQKNGDLSAAEATAAHVRPIRRLGSPWIFRAAALVLVTFSGIALWKTFPAGARGNADVRNLAVTIPGMNRIASSIDNVAGQRVRQERFRLASGREVAVDIMAGPQDRILRDDESGEANAPGLHTDSTDAGAIVVFEKSGFHLRLTALMPVSELQNIAAGIVLSSKRRE